MTVGESGGRTRGRGLVAFACALLGSFAVAVAIVVTTGWGGDDIGVFLFWTIPFAALLGVAGRLFAGRLAERGPSSRVAAAAVGGALAGAGWTLVVAVLLGPFFLGFGFPVIAAWALGGAAALVAASSLRSDRAVRRAKRASYAALAAFVLLAVVAPAVLGLLFEDRADLVVEVREGTTDSQAQALVDQIFEVRESTGDRALESVSWSRSELRIEFHEAASDAGRAEVRRLLERHPLVERVGKP